MSKPSKPTEEDRKGFVARQVDKFTKVKPEPEKTDALGFEKPDPRKGRAMLSIWLNPAAIRQFKTLAFSKDKSQQDMMAEALNLLFQKYSLQEIA